MSPGHEDIKCKTESWKTNNSQTRKTKLQTCILTEGKRSIAQEHSGGIVGAVDDYFCHCDVPHAGIIRGIRQHELKLLRWLILAVVDQRDITGGHADPRAQYHTVL